MKFNLEKKLPEVAEIIQRNSGWVIREVAQESDMPEQQREVARHRGQKKRTQREGSEGGQECTGGGAHREDVQHDSLKGTAWDPVGSFSGDDDTRERQRRETVKATKERRYLRKRSREGGSRGGSSGNGTGYS